MVDENIDELLAGIEKADEPRAMTGGETDPKAAATPEKAEAAPSEPAPWDPKPWEFDWNGKKVAPDSLEKARTWMSQGYNYSERSAQLNRLQRDLSSQQERYKGFDRYAEIDKFAKATPGWMDWVNTHFAQRGSWKPDQQPGDPNLLSAIQPLQQQIQELTQWREQQLTERQKQDEQRHDEALSNDIKEIREANPNIDFDAKDQSGKPLELRILEHAAEIGTSSFRAAFRDYLHDQLLGSAKAQTLEEKAKAPQAAKERGILGVSPTPKKSPGRPVSTKGRSYDDLAKMAMDEFGLS